MEISYANDLSKMSRRGFIAIIDIAEEGPDLDIGLGSLVSGSVSIEPIARHRDFGEVNKLYKVTAWDTTLEILEAELKDLLTLTSGDQVAAWIKDHAAAPPDGRGVTEKTGRG